ncbi:MAG TPA: sialidase family protein [Phycisphaerales bacterium]|nr:sialidase family protein [Phycisphaerales bacterium]
MNQTTIAALLLAAACTAGAVAQVRIKIDHGDDEAHEHDERPDDPYMPPGPLRTSVPAIFGDRQGFPLSVQVNVTTAQLNILNDAANEPSIAVDPTAPNRITIGWRQFDNIASNFRQAGYAWSNDGGLTWNKSTIDPGVFRSDPVLRASADGTIYYNSLTEDFSCWVLRSTNGGAAWSSPVFSFGGDKQWMAVDRTTGPGRGFIHQWWSTAANPTPGLQYTRSTNGGLAWQSPSAVLGTPIWGTMAVGPAGELYLAKGSGGVRAIKSTDANQTAAAPTFTQLPLIGFNGAGTGRACNPGGLAGQAYVGVDTSGGPRNGWVYLLATVPAAGATDVVFARSQDAGATWSTPVVFRGGAVTDTNSFQWFGTMSVAPSGRIDVVYNDTSSTLNAVNSQLVYTASSDGGVTWTTPAAMGPVFNSTIGYPNQNKMGDYYDMESDLLGAHVAYAATYNGEQDVYYLRIGPKDCNGNGVADDAETLSAAVLDTNANAIPDSCEIAAGAVPDANGNGFPDNACGDIDFNNDGLFPDTADIDDFLVVFSGGACSAPQCDGVDFNHDGLFPDTADIDFLLRVFSGGPC